MTTTNVRRHQIMRNLQTFRRSTVRYWERRRIIYNVALVLPALIGYGFADTLNWVGDEHTIHYAYVIPLFLVSAVGANVCYSLAYAAEFVFASDNPISRWVRFGRSTTFVCGVLLAMLLALVGGRNIADMEWDHGIKPVGRPGTAAVMDHSLQK